MNKSEVAILAFGIIQYLLFAFAQETMLVGATKQNHFVDPTINFFSVRDVSRRGFKVFIQIYIDFFKGFAVFLFSGFRFKRQIADDPDFVRGSSFADDLSREQEFEAQTLKRARFYIYGSNLVVISALIAGFLFALHQTGPESYIRPIDLLLIFVFNIFSICCLVLAYETRVQILRGRYALIIDKLMRRQKRNISDTDLEQIYKVTNTVLNMVEGDVGQRDNTTLIKSYGDDVLPEEIDEIVKSLVADPEAARKFLLDNRILTDTHSNVLQIKNKRAS